ncbi:ICAM5 protein, partial [Rhinopomastus cyanomelas]|nr:ICAM5 protein [Rhinopomastus cyanomelas]
RAGRAVSRHDAGRYLCRATNRHGAAVRSVTVTVECERGRRAGGRQAGARCPRPPVSCSKPGAPPQPPWTPNVTRAHAGTYLCQASNSRGTARRNVSVTVDFGPAAVTLRALPSALVPLGSSFRLECGAEGSPPPSFSWELPPAPNLRLGPHNRSVAVAGALGANRGLYSCSAGNQHGRVVATVSVRVLESRPGLGATLGALGVLLAALAALGGLQLKRSSGRRGDYNVREAEGAAQRPHNKGEPPEGCGIQLGPP